MKGKFLFDKNLMRVLSTLGFLVALMSLVVTWITLKSSLSVLNYVLIGFVLFGIAIAYEVEVVQDLVRKYRRDKLIRRLTEF